MTHWKRILAVTGTAAVVLANIGAVTQPVFADQTLEEEIPVDVEDADTDEESEESTGTLAEEPEATVEESEDENDSAEEETAAEDESNPTEETASEEETTAVKPVADNDTDAPEITGITIAGNEGVAADGSVSILLDEGLGLANASVILTTSEAVHFVATDSAASGELYAVSAADGQVSLRFKVAAGSTDLDTDAYRLDLTSSDGKTWTGKFSSGFDATAGSLAEALDAVGSSLRAGTFVDAAGNGNERADIYSNEDAANVQLVFCGKDVTRYQVTYHYDGGSYKWSVPSGAPLVEAEVSSNLGNVTWYTDAAYTNAATFGGAVTSNMDLYAKSDASADVSAFSEGLDAGDAILYISGSDDWAAFTSRSSEVKSSQRVVLKADIDCGGASYTALIFAGDLDGQGHTISNATFSASGDCNGLFASLSGNQRICNLTLSMITVRSASYAGALAGTASGGNGIIQNIQVRNCAVSGNNAGGVIGLTEKATVQYCSNRGGRVTGLSNGGGIVGINYGTITDCYAAVSPTATLSTGRGGICGKNLGDGVTNWSWCTYARAAGRTHEQGINNLTSVSNATSEDDFVAWGGERLIWSFADGTATDFDVLFVYYDF